MSSFIDKRRALDAMLCICIFIFIVLNSNTSKQRNTALDCSSKMPAGYFHNKVVLHKHLHQIYVLVNAGRIDEAENTFLDMRQVWYLQDLLAEQAKSTRISQSHFPSDSLSRLERLINERQNNDYGSQLESVPQEIKRIQLHLDAEVIPGFRCSELL